MKTRSESFLFEDKLEWETTGVGVRRQIMGYDGQIMLVKLEFDKGGSAPMHSHFHSQTTYISSGKFEATIGDEKRIIGAGDGLYFEPDQIHGIVCLEPGVAIDVFTPHRADFLKK